MIIDKTESELKSALVAKLRKDLPGVVIFRHADQLTAGVPDLSVTWGRRTAWIEVKKAPPRGRGLQTKRMSELAAAGLAVYVIYDLKQPATYVCRTLSTSYEEIIECAAGIDHSVVSYAIKKLIAELD